MTPKEEFELFMKAHVEQMQIEHKKFILKMSIELGIFLILLFTGLYLCKFWEVWYLSQIGKL